jgi:hypothetical protein
MKNRPAYLARKIRQQQLKENPNVLELDTQKIEQTMKQMANRVTLRADAHEIMYAAALIIACSLDQTCKTYDDKLEKLELVMYFIVNWLNREELEEKHA